MDFKEIIELQKKFDSMHKSRFAWDSKITNDNLELLEFLLIALVGEVGELSNLVKKIIRGDFTLNEMKENIEEELSDILIYFTKLCYQLDIDIEKGFKKKMQKNYERFEKYKK